VKDSPDTTSRSGISSPVRVKSHRTSNLRPKVARPLPGEEVRQLLHDYLSWEIVVNDPASVLAALAIETRYHASFWDALILQAAERSGATVLYSEDLAASPKYGAVQVVNPPA